MILKKGTRVIVRGKRTGTVVYVRLASPDFKKPSAYSIQLDGNHNGTIFPAEEVKPIKV